MSEVKTQMARAVVTRVSKWAWEIHIEHGLSVYGPNGGSWYRVNRAAAQRKGRRELRRYLRNKDFRQEVIVVWASDATVWRGR